MKGEYVIYQILRSFVFERVEGLSKYMRVLVALRPDDELA